MATFQGFNFRASPAGNSGFPVNGDANTNSTAILATTDYVYDPAKGYGWTGSTPTSASNKTNPKDPRLGGAVTFPSSTTVFRIDLPNGQYDIRLAVGGTGASTQSVKLFDGSTLITEVTTGSTSVPQNSEMTAASTSGAPAVVTDTDWINNNDLIRVTITNRYLGIGKGSSITALEHVATQVVPGALQDVRLDTDDSGNVVNTTGTTTAGSASITGMPSPSGIFVGMLASGPAIPAGVTVEAITKSGAQATSLTLSTGVGVTALSGGALRFGWPITLYDKQPLEELIAPITSVTGANTVGAYTITTSDGVTINPYIKALSFKGIVWLAYTGLSFPSGGPANHTFGITQTDGSGNFTGSPRTTMFTSPLIFAPTKPTDGSVLAKISTPAFLQRKATIDKLNSIKWLGYKGQALQVLGDVLVNSIASLISAATSLAANAGANKWFRIRCTNGVVNGVAADWNTSSANANNTVINFMSEAGGGLLIEPNAGENIMIRGGIYLADNRGVHWRGLTFCGTTVASLRVGHNTAQGVLTAMIVERCKFGYLHDPAYSRANYKSQYGNFQDAILCTAGGDQLTVVDCWFYGAATCMNPQQFRTFESCGNVCTLCSNDFHAFNSANSLTIPFQGATLPDQAMYVWIHGCICYDQIDNALSFGYDGSNNLTSPHTDFMQVRSAVPKAPATSPYFIVLEDSILLANNLEQQINPGTGKPDYVSRPFINQATETPAHNVFINNIGMDGAIRGLDTGGGGISYAEFNTILPSPVLPAGVGPTVGVTPGIQMVIPSWATGVTKTRKNIVGVDGSNVSGGYTAKDDLVVTLAYNTHPETVLTGPFTARASDNGATWTFAVPDGATVAPNDERRGIWAALKPLVGYGAQSVVGRIPAGGTDTITQAESLTLMAITEQQPSGAVSGTASLRWNSGAGETGGRAGADVTFSVQ